MQEIPTLTELENEAAKNFISAFPQMEIFRAEIAQLGEELLKSQSEKTNTEIKSSDIATRFLFMRIFTDCFAISTLAFNGYSLQAATLTSSSFESAFTIMYIGANDDKAKQWLEHPNPFKNPVNLYDRVQGVWQNDGYIGDALKNITDMWYQIYDTLCSVKHITANVQTNFNFMISNETLGFHFGADPTPRSVWLSAYTLAHLFRFFLWSIKTIALCHSDISPQQAFWSKYEKMDYELSELHESVNKYQEVNDLKLWLASV
ncbi:MAG: hypothetical protein RLZZ156_842 [Deinococcota bacterium]